MRNLDKWRNEGMLVYNRVGDLVWTRNPYLNTDPFMGIGMEGEELPGGTYYFIFKYKVLNNNGVDEPRNKAGFVEIYR
ncbi:MAG: gliding motility-associated C-terminal domain-containing protein [Bacteroidetes bacterium]|nr:gliding motility-associated C-terminal domain-containing protein [Bacteroidota bacterium]